MTTFTITAKLYSSSLTVRHIPGADVSCTWTGKPDGATEIVTDTDITLEEPKPRRSRQPASIEIVVPHEAIVYQLSLAAGEIDIDTTAAASTINSAAGDIQIRRIVDSKLKSGAGNVAITELERSNVKLGMGNLKIDTVRGASEIKNGAGDVKILNIEGEATPKTVAVKSGTGNISLAVARGTAAHLTCKTGLGHVESELDETAEVPDVDHFVYIDAKAGLGNISVLRA